MSMTLPVIGIGPWTKTMIPLSIAKNIPISVLSSSSQRQHGSERRYRRCQTQEKARNNEMILEVRKVIGKSKK
jgi:hypothetical protein